MNFIDAVQSCFVKYADFNGCASRSEFLVVVCVHIGRDSNASASQLQRGCGVFFRDVIPSIAVTARRLHDVDRSGWWQLLYCFPIIGWFILIFFCIEPTQPNRYLHET